MRVLRLFNEPAGHACSHARGVPAELVAQPAAARHLRRLQPAGGDQDGAPLRAGRATTCCSPASPTPRTLYQTRLAELTAARGAYAELRAAQVDLERYLLGTTTDHLRELRYQDRKAHPQPQVLHLGRAAGQAPSRSSTRCGRPSFWTDLQAQLPEWDRAIEAFNQRRAAVPRQSGGAARPAQGAREVTDMTTDAVGRRWRRHRRTRRTSCASCAT